MESGVRLLDSGREREDGVSDDRAVSPVRLTGEMSPELSRWLWLVKWALMIPHYIVLFFLWVAYFFVSVGAFFAILVTGRYPRGLFDFTSGVLRWTWRVGFYSYSAPGNHADSPFSLKDGPGEPPRLRGDHSPPPSPGRVARQGGVV